MFFAFFSFPDIKGFEQTTTKQTIPQAILSPLGYNSSKNIFPYLVRSTSIPDSIFEEIVIPYPGIPFKMAGNRSFGDWSISFNVDEKGILLDAFNSWHELIYNTRTNQYNEPSIYMKDQQLFLIDGLGMTTKKIHLFNAWPKTLGSIGFDYSSSEVATMDITFSYQSYTITNEDTGGTANTLMKSLLNKVTGSARGIF